MAIKDLVRPELPPPTPAGERPPNITCEKYTRGEDGKRCIHFQQGGTCALPDERVAVHPEAVATALYRAERGRLLRRELRALLELGWRHERDVVVARSERVRFDHDGDRRRCAVLHLPSARKFVSGRSKPVPAR